jgi:uncharacterized damage-inducible protein DinB
LLELIQSMMAYNEAMRRRLWQSTMQLTDGQFVAETDYSHGSIRNQMVHLATVDGRWLRGLKGQPEARFFNLDPAGYPTRQAAYDVWAEVSEAMMAYVGSLSEVAVHRVPAGMYGPAWQILLHVVNHGTDHRAQVLQVLASYGAPTFEQDLIMYLWGGS